jgi:hypothetical protein
MFTVYYCKMKSFMKNMSKITHNRTYVFGAAMVFILAIGALGIVLKSNSDIRQLQEESEQTALVQGQEVAKLKEIAQKTKEDEAKKLAAQQQAGGLFTDPVESAKSPEETQSAEDKAANRYSNVYGASKVSDAVCGPSTSGAPGSLVVNYSRDQMNSGQPFTVTISTPDGSTLGKVYINAVPNFSASPKEFTSDKSSTSFTAKYEGGLANMGPSMTSNTSGYIYISTFCGSRAFGANISV